MLKYFFTRVLCLIPAFLLLIAISFILVRLSPGSPFDTESGRNTATKMFLEERYGLDLPLYQQLFNYMKLLASGDLGASFAGGFRTVGDILRENFMPSIKLGIVTFIFSLCFGIGLGWLAALYQNTWIDYLVMAVTGFVMVVPNHIRTTTIALGSAAFNSGLPMSGWHHGDFTHMLLPVFAFSLSSIAQLVKLMRASLIEVLRENYIRTARAKGLPQGYVLFNHALKPAILPLIPHLAPLFSAQLTGSLIVENTFSIPGIGRLMSEAARNSDYPMILALTLIFGALTLIFNVFGDTLLVFLNPKVRHATFKG